MSQSEIKGCNPSKESPLTRTVKLAAFFLLLVLPIAAQAQFLFTTNNGAITITGYTNSPSVLIIPDTINGMPVTSIGTQAFASDTNLTSITIGNNVTNIGQNAFEECFILTNLVIGTNVTSIPSGMCFFCISLSSITIPSNVTSIGEQGFWLCTSLTNATIPNSVTNIFMEAFQDCWALPSITIPPSVASIGNEAFISCYSLTNVYFQGNAPSSGNAVFSDEYLGNGVFANTNNTIAYYLPGTTGWSNSLCSNPAIPAVLWNPTMQTTDGSFGLQNSKFGFNITGTTNIPIVVEANTDLTQPTWSPLFNGTVTNGEIYFSDPLWTNYPNRFYRIRSP
jgi:BspA type Leucine rich repeat region (6 copies)